MFNVMIESVGVLDGGSARRMVQLRHDCDGARSEELNGADCAQH